MRGAISSPVGTKLYRDKDGTRKWKIDIRIEVDGQVRRFRKGGIPTKEMAMSIVAKIRTEALEDRFLGARPHVSLTVSSAWAQYSPISKRDKRSTETDHSRAKHFLRLLGSLRVENVNQRVIDRYRAQRRTEVTPFGGNVSVAQMNREVALLRRVFSYAKECGDIEANPLAGVKLLKEDNVRQVVISEAEFDRLVTSAEPLLVPILYVAFDTGMRKAEVLKLKWKQVDLRTGTIRLFSADTKSREPRNIYLTPRVIEQLQSIPRAISGFVFVNPRTGRPWNQIKKMFTRARERAGLSHIWFHDLRRSFVTHARKRGVSESVVMRMSGHRTRAVFDRYNVVDDSDLQRAMELILAGQMAEKSENFGHFLDTSGKSAVDKQKALQVST